MGKTHQWGTAVSASKTGHILCSIATRLTKILINNALPQHCSICQQPSRGQHAICDACTRDLPLNDHHCQRCAVPLNTIKSIEAANVPLCGNCLSHDYYFDRVYSPYHYDAGVRYLIKQFKYRQKLHYAPLLSFLFSENLTENGNFRLPQALLAMPLHPKRLRDRGYNQSAELAKLLGKHFRRPVITQCLFRERHTAVQAGLTAKQRQRNVHNAFSVKKSVHYAHIALVDDVMTTGSTVDEAARILKQQACIGKVDVWTIARA